MEIFKRNLIKIAIIVFAAIGIYLQMFDSVVDFMGGPSMVLFFTIQSNFGMIVIALVGIIYSLRKKEVGLNYTLIKYVLTVAIVLTYFVFTLLLTPNIHIVYLLSSSNIFVHSLVPLLSVLDYLIFDKKIEVKKQTYYGLIMPLCYLVFAYGMYGLGVKFGEEKFPYFFMDFTTYGWFNISESGLGVIYWFVIILGIVCLISYLLKKMKQLKSRNVPLITTIIMIGLTIFMTTLQAIK